MTQSNGSKNIRFVALNIFLLFVSIYLLTSVGHTVLDSDASVARYEATRSMAERLDLSIPEGLGVRGSDGHDYSWFGLGYSLLAVPFYVISKQIGIPPENAVSIINQLVGAATVALVFLFAVRLGYSRRASCLVALCYGLGTIAWPLAEHPFDHVVETSFILLSVYLVYRHILSGKTRHLVLAAFSVGFAFLTRPTAILAIPSLVMMLIVSLPQQTGTKGMVKAALKKIILLATAFLPFLLLTFWYNYYRFGNIFETGYGVIAARTGLDFFSGTPLLTGLGGFLTSPGKGFFFYSPVAILFFFTIRPFFKKHSGLALCFIGIITSYLLFLSKNIYWHGDIAWGPRYILATTPCFIMPIAELFNSYTWREKPLLRKAIYFVFAVSVTIQLTAVSVTPDRYFLHLHNEEKVKFTVVKGDGVPSIVEPPAEIYFDWHKSPILAQLRFFYDSSLKIADYRHSSLSDEIKSSPKKYLYDFWWLCSYVRDGSFTGIIVVLAFICIIAYISYILNKLVRE